MRHLKLKQGVCGMATHTREIHQDSKVSLSAEALLAA